jgi:hypothetical protein
MESRYDHGVDRCFRLFLQGAGSILVLIPSTPSVGRVSFVRHPDVADSIREHWERVGEYIRSSIEEERVEAQGTSEPSPR